MVWSFVHVCLVSVGGLSLLDIYLGKHHFKVFILVMSCVSSKSAKSGIANLIRNSVSFSNTPQWGSSSPQPRS